MPSFFVMIIAYQITYMSISPIKYPITIALSLYQCSMKPTYFDVTYWRTSLNIMSVLVLVKFLIHQKIMKTLKSPQPQSASSLSACDQSACLN